MGIATETWLKEAYLAKHKYIGEFLPTLTSFNADEKVKSKHITVIPAQSASYLDYGSTASVTYTSVGLTDKELIIKDTAYVPFFLTDEQVNTTAVSVIRDTTKQAINANMNAIEKEALLQMAIGSASGNKIELATGDAITLANLQAMEKNLRENGSNMENAYLVVNPEFLIKLMNVEDNSEKIFIKRSVYGNDVLEKGVVGTILGFKVLMSNNLPTLNDAGTAYDAAGETAAVYYDGDAMVVAISKHAKIETERNIDTLPIKNKVLCYFNAGNVVRNANICGHLRKYSA